MSTTAIYTHVSIKRLKAVHDETHPAARIGPKNAVPNAPIQRADELLRALKDEALEEEPP